MPVENVPDRDAAAINASTRMESRKMNNLQALQRLSRTKDLVVREFDAGDWLMLANCMGENGEIITAHGRLLRSMYWGDEDYPACVSDVMARLFQRDPTFLDAVDEILKGKNLVKADVGPAPEDAVFVSEGKVSKIDETLVSAMMPFGPDFDDVRETMRGACREVGLQLKAADDIWDSTILIEDIFFLIAKSRIIIVDFTGKNPNVMYETGVAHALGKQVIPIVRNLEDVPFDLRHHRVLTYENNAEGRRKLQLALSERLNTIMSKQDMAKC